jgi:hypothetical protein
LKSVPFKICSNSNLLKLKRSTYGLSLKKVAAHNSSFAGMRNLLISDEKKQTWASPTHEISDTAHTHWLVTDAKCVK